MEGDRDPGDGERHAPRSGRGVGGLVIEAIGWSAASGRAAGVAHAAGVDLVIGPGSVRHGGSIAAGRLARDAGVDPRGAPRCSEVATTLSDLVERTPASRDRVVDFLRGISILAVVFGHWFIGIIWWDGGIIRTTSAVGVTSYLWVGTWLLQVMPIFFFVGGFSNYVTYTAMRERGRDRWRVRAIASRSVAAALAGVLRGVGRGPGRAAPHRHRRAGRSDAVGRDDAASRRPAARSHGAVRSAVVPGGLSGGGGAVAVDDRAPPAVRPVGARRHGGGRGGLRRDRVRLRAAAGAVGQRGVRPAAAAPTGALLR